MFGLGRKLVTGVVVDKKDYPGQPEKPGTIVGTKASAFVSLPTPAIEERWSLIVNGVDKNGKELQKEIYVDPNEWNNTKVGDKYTPQEK
jgi:hypothetical protein